MLSLGDADCILITQWTPYGPQRILIDGGNSGDAPAIKEFLRSRGASNLWAIVCSHPHSDHASGLIELILDKSVTFSTGWMHDIRNHLPPDTLRRASAGNSPQANGVRQVVETTKELAAAFTARYVTPAEPFANSRIAASPQLVVVGPTPSFYRGALREFIGTVPTPTTSARLPLFGPGLSLAPVPLGLQLSALAGSAPAPIPYATLSGFRGVQPPPLGLSPIASMLYSGTLKNSSVQEAPKTQPFNNTSTILGLSSPMGRFLFTADCGSSAFIHVPAAWHNLTWMQIPHHGSDGNMSKTDIAQLCPKFAYVSACGDSSHPDRAVVSGLKKVGTKIFSTHQNGNLRFSCGNVPLRLGYGPAVEMLGTTRF